MLRWISVVAAAVCLVLPGCGGPKTNYKYRIALVPKGATHQHWESVRRGAERAPADLTAQGIAVEVIWDAPLTEDKADEQIAIIDRHVGRKVSGIILAPQHSKQMIRPVEDAVKQGIPVVILDSNLDADELKRNPALEIKYVATDNYNGGKLAAKHLLETLEKQGKPAPRLLLLPYQLGSESTEQREKGFLDEIARIAKKQKDEGKPCVILVEHKEYAGGTVDSAEKASGRLLTRLKNENLDGIFAVNESSTSGMLNAMRSLGLNKKIVLMGFDQSEPLRQAVEEGDVIGLVVQDPFKMGYLGLWDAVQYLEGYDVAPDGKKELSTGEYYVKKEDLQKQESRERFDPELQNNRKIETPTYKKK